MNQTTIVLAISALEAERSRVDGALAELRSSLNGHRVVRSRAVMGGVMPTPLSEPSKARGRRGRRRISAAGRKALSEAARRRWAKARAAGKRTL
jgi:hypothetical protein